MRNVIGLGEQMIFGQVDISEIDIDLRCRDEIPQALLGLRFIYCDFDTRAAVFRILEEEVPVRKTDTGRPGMDIWQILVLAILRVNCNWDWDKIMYMANTHGQIREMMGIGEWDGKRFALQTIKDNVSLLKPDTLSKIGALAVKAGHRMLKVDGLELTGRCDSFVVETDVHYPTDINLLLDAMRKIVFMTAELSLNTGVPGWRKVECNYKKTKKLYRKCQKLKRSASGDAIRGKRNDALIIEAFEAYLAFAGQMLSRARETLTLVSEIAGVEVLLQIAEVERFMAHAERQIDQIERRCLKGEVIPHDEKVFSVFEEHTEWISKGKAGVPFELGLKVCVMEDKYGFVLHHKVMERTMDVDVTVEMVEKTLENFPLFNGCSFDKGFWSPENQKALEGMIDHPTLPKKGRLSVEDGEREHSEEFMCQRRKHSAVESCINALENHGLDKCRDHGLFGFERYVALAVLGRNVQKLGAMIRDAELKRRKRKYGGLRKTA